MQTRLGSCPPNFAWPASEKKDKIQRQRWIHKVHKEKLPTLWIRERKARLKWMWESTRECSREISQKYEMQNPIYVGVKFMQIQNKSKSTTHLRHKKLFYNEKWCNHHHLDNKHHVCRCVWQIDWSCKLNLAITSTMGCPSLPTVVRSRHAKCN